MDAFTFSKQPNRLAIAYQGPASGKQYELWREGVCRSFCQLDTEPSASGRIDCRIDFSFLNGLTLATPTGSSARFARTRELLPDGCDDLVLIFATRGPVHVTGKERTVELATSQACLTEMSAAAGVALNDTGLFTATRMPRGFFLEVAPNAESRLYQPLGENPASARMVQRYFALCNDLARDLDAEGRQAAAEHLMELISLLLKTGSESSGPIEGRRHSAARLDLLKSEALKNLTRGNLNIAMISQASGLSARQTQRLFARTGVTFTEFVLEQRLSLAHRLLTNPEHRHRKVSDLAYDTGFRDLSYFHRAFRRRFGMTPSDLRYETGRSRLN
jgi:AraC-like DNA-binding protein